MWLITFGDWLLWIGKILACCGLLFIFGVILYGCGTGIYAAYRNAKGD